MTAHRKPANSTCHLTDEDIDLVFALVEEKAKLREEEGELRARIRVIQAQKKQLTIHSIADKFDCSPHHISALLYTGRQANE